jgi:uncharacterized protein YggT (Ycf19 family)
MRRSTVPPDDHVHGEHVVTADSGAAAGRVLIQVLSLILWVLEALLVTRLLLKLLGANERTAFVEFIYNLTQPLVQPFVGIFEQVALGSGVLEWASLVALIVYGIVGAIIIQLVSSLMSGTRTVVRH